MGQAKQRGSLDDRVSAARARIDAMRPESIICNECERAITDIVELNTRGMDGIDVAFAAVCPECGSSTYAIKGQPASVEALMLAMTESTGDTLLFGVQ